MRHPYHKMLDSTSDFFSDVCPKSIRIIYSYSAISVLGNYSMFKVTKALEHLKCTHAPLSVLFFLQEHPRPKYETILLQKRQRKQKKKKKKKKNEVGGD